MDAPTPHVTPPAGYEIAYREARLSLENQERSVVELRSRAGTLIASAAITTSFFGGREASRQPAPLAALVAIGCFLLLGLIVVLILWPRRDWEFSIAPAHLIAAYLEPVDTEPIPLHLVQRDLALHMGRSASLNRRQLHLLTILFRAGSILLIAEVLSWVLALAKSGTA